MSGPKSRQDARVLREAVGILAATEGRRRNMRRNPWRGINTELADEYDEAWQRGLDERNMVIERNRRSSDPRRYEEGCDA